MIYLDYNATSPLHPKALEAMLPYLRDSWANPSSPHRLGCAARAAVEKARRQVAECLGCKAKEIFFTGSGTESDNLAIRGVLAASGRSSGHIITNTIEHPAVLRTCQALEKQGYAVSYVSVDDGGVVRLDELVNAIRSDTILISVMHANNETGVMQPVKEISEVAEKHRIVFHVDAVQTLGKCVRDMPTIGANLISFSAHKFGGPKGVGGLYLKTGTRFESVITGGGQEGGVRSGTENVAGIVGMAAALAVSCEEMDMRNAHTAELRNRFEKRVLENLNNVIVNGARHLRVPNTSNMSFHAVDGESVVLALGCQDVFLSTGSACSSGEELPSHVLLAMGRSPRMAQGAVRVSLGPQTTENDVDCASNGLIEAVKKLRMISSV